MRTETGGCIALCGMSEVVSLLSLPDDLLAQTALNTRTWHDDELYRS